MRQLYELVREDIQRGRKWKERDGGFKSSQDELLGLFPGVRWVTEVTICSGLAVNRLLQVELLHDDTGPKVPVLSDNLDEL